MAVWHLSIKVGDVFYDEALTFSEKRDIIVSRIRESLWPSLSLDPEDLKTVVKKLEMSTHVDDFNYHWDSLYDLADEDRVWIDRF